MSEEREIRYIFDISDRLGSAAREIIKIIESPLVHSLWIIVYVAPSLLFVFYGFLDAASLGLFDFESLREDAVGKPFGASSWVSL